MNVADPEEIVDDAGEPESGAGALLALVEHEPLRDIAGDEIAHRGVVGKLRRKGPEGGAVRQVAPLGDDPFELHAANLLIEEGSIRFEMLGKTQARPAVDIGQHFLQQLLAALERQDPQVLAIQMEQIEEIVFQAAGASFAKG